MSDDAAQLRRRQAEAREAIEALSSEEGGASAAFVGQVFSGGAIPTTVPKVFLTHPIEVTCAESAGSVPAVAVGSQTVPVLVLGPGVPVAGDRLIARQVDGLWVASMPGGAPPACGMIRTMVHSGCLNASNQPTPLSGVIVTVKQGSTTIGTCTTNAAGQCDIPIAAAGSYTVEIVSPSTRYATPSPQTISATCTTNGVGFTLAPAADYAFLSPCCCPLPVPRTLMLSDGTNTFPITYSAPDNGWKACRNYTASGGTFFDGIGFGGLCGSFTNYPITTPITFLFKCNGLLLSYPGCAYGIALELFAMVDCTCAAPKGTGGHTSPRTAPLAGTLASCNPVAWSGSITWPSDDPARYVWPGGATFTISE